MVRFGRARFGRSSGRREPKRRPRLAKMACSRTVPGGDPDRGPPQLPLSHEFELANDLRRFSGSRAETLRRNLGRVSLSFNAVFQ